MRTPNQKAWLKFSRGSWQSSMPTKAGTYPTRTRLGAQGPSIKVSYDPQGELTPEQVWDGDWWSEAIPNLPGYTD